MAINQKEASNQEKTFDPIDEPTRGSEIVVEALKREGVDQIFGYPGGASMEIHQAFTEEEEVDVVLTRHEQGAAFAAQGYARTTGEAGVCLATSGPGATNLLTGIQDAKMDSIPLVAITGQVPRDMIGDDAFQETDIIGATMQMTKHNYLIQDIDDIAETVEEAFYLAETGRPGPVLIDIPKDVQQEYTVPNFADAPDRPGYSPNYEANPRQVKQAAKAIEDARKPVIYCGGGIVAAEASEELRELADSCNIPVTTTVMGLGVYPEHKDKSLKMLGMHGTEYANLAVAQCDLLIALGVRFDDRVTGNVDEFAKHADIIHVDIDPSEINKNKVVDIPIVSDVKDALEKLNETVEPDECEYEEWHEQIQDWKSERPLRYKERDDVIMPQYVCERLSDLAPNDSIITVGVGQHQMFAAQHYDFSEPRTWLSSSGLGTMGFGYPSAVGAKVAKPDREVIDIDGDGSFMMNEHELATVAQHDIGAKAIILNNYHLGMVVQWEDRFYGGTRGDTYIGDPEVDFVKICEGHGVEAERISQKENLDEAIERLLDYDGPYVLEVIVPHEEHVLPMIPSGGTIDDMITPDFGPGEEHDE
jgi:acetolactate synthase-1/2/3 large subunit